MKYEVRFLANGFERTEYVDADSAADAVRVVQEQFVSQGDTFELIQVQLLDGAGV